MSRTQRAGVGLLSLVVGAMCFGALQKGDPTVPCLLDPQHALNSVSGGLDGANSAATVGVTDASC